jgi:hypothetical protein
MERSGRVTTHSPFNLGDLNLCFFNLILRSCPWSLGNRPRGLSSLSGDENQAGSSARSARTGSVSFRRLRVGWPGSPNFMSVEVSALATVIAAVDFPKLVFT